MQPKLRQPTTQNDEAADVERAGKIFDDHLARMFPDPMHAGMLKSWMAWVVQNPGSKAMWSPVICGPQGVGKSLLGGILKACLGPSNVRTLISDMLAQRWSDWLRDAACLIVDEPRVKTCGVAENVERFMTDPNIRANIIFLLNDVSNFEIYPAERRYFILHATPAHTWRVSEPGADYWESVWSLTSGLAGAIRSHMQSFTLHPAFSHQRVPPAVSANFGRDAATPQARRSTILPDLEIIANATGILANYSILPIWQDSADDSRSGMLEFAGKLDEYVRLPSAETKRALLLRIEEELEQPE
jgi:hypothetical protein